MQRSFDQRPVPSNALVWGCVVSLSVVYAVAIAHGIVTIDVARDLYWGQQIARGDAFPLIGPPVGTLTILGPILYYVVAAVLSISGSMTTYFALMGLLAAGKFVMAYLVGRRWLGSGFGVSLAVASAVPGIVSYQLLGIGHPWFVELTLWTAAWCALRLLDTPKRMRWAFGLGTSAALALHAHPTALVLLPWAAIALAQLPRPVRWRAACTAALAALAVFLPLLIAMAAPLLAANGAADNAVGPSGIGGSVSGTVNILQNLVWTQSINIFDSFLTNWAWGLSLAAVLWSAVLALTAVGLWFAAWNPGLRRTLAGASASLLWTALALALLRDHTPFYMAFVALLPFAVILALAWIGLLGAGGRLRHIAWLTVLLLVISIHVATGAGIVEAARKGKVNSYLPLHSNMQDVTTVLHIESVLAAPTRDALARWLCAQAQQVSLHGDIAAAFDMGLRHETDLACPQQRRMDSAGGRDPAYVGLPKTVLGMLPVAEMHDVGAYGLVRVQRVIAPLVALPDVTGRRYPPRFETMIAAAKQGEWSITATLPANEVLVVSSLLPTFPFYKVVAHANGAPIKARTTFANTSIFRCNSCGLGPVRWEVKIQGGVQEAVSITSVLSASGSATLSQ